MLSPFMSSPSVGPFLLPNENTQSVLFRATHTAHYAPPDQTAPAGFQNMAAAPPAARAGPNGNGFDTFVPTDTMPRRQPAMAPAAPISGQGSSLKRKPMDSPRMTTGMDKTTNPMMAPAAAGR